MGIEVASSRFFKQDFKVFEKRLAEETALLGAYWASGSIATILQMNIPRPGLSWKHGWSIKTASRAP